MYSVKTIPVFLLSLWVLGSGCNESEKRDDSNLKFEAEDQLDSTATDESTDSGQDQNNADLGERSDAAENVDAGINMNEVDLSLTDADAPLIDPDMNAEDAFVEPSNAISDLSVADWALFCSSMSGALDAFNISDEDLRYGHCVGEYNATTEDYFSSTVAECGAFIADCYDNLDSAHQLPIGICANTDTVPEDCPVEVDVFDSCLRGLMEHQVAMGYQDVCSPEQGEIMTFRQTFELYRAAQACIDELASECPAIRAD